MSVKLRDVKKPVPFSELIGPVEKYLEKYWDIDAKPRGYKDFCEDYTDFKGQGEDDDRLLEEFKGINDETATMFAFPIAASLPHIAYDDICQGRNPLMMLISHLIAYGIGYGKKLAEIGGTDLNSLQKMQLDLIQERLKITSERVYNIAPKYNELCGDCIGPKCEGCERAHISDTQYAHIREKLSEMFHCITHGKAEKLENIREDLELEGVNVEEAMQEFMGGIQNIKK